MDFFLPALNIERAKKLNPQINLPFNLLIQKYFFHDDPTWNINYFVFQVGTRSISTHGKKY